MRNHKLSLLADRRPRGIDFAGFRVLGPGLIGLLDLKLGGCNTSLKRRCRFWRLTSPPVLLSELQITHCVNGLECSLESKNHLSPSICSIGIHVTFHPSLRVELWHTKPYVPCLVTACPHGLCSTEYRKERGRVKCVYVSNLFLYPRMWMFLSITVFAVRDSKLCTRRRSDDVFVRRVRNW